MFGALLYMHRSKLCVEYKNEQSGVTKIDLGPPSTGICGVKRTNEVK
jgi:hypothetical protein